MQRAPASPPAQGPARPRVDRSLVQVRHREECLVCRRAKRVCVCGQIAPFEAAADVVFLQHPREARNVLGTVRMAHLQLPGSRLHKGVEFADDAAVQALLAAERARSVVLYPGRGARDAETLADDLDGLRPLVWIIDGTWAQARKMWNHNAWLRELPAYRLNPRELGRYRIRKEPAAHCLSTIEATAQLLDVIGGTPGQHSRLLTPFDAMVETQLGFVGQGSSRFRARPNRVARRVLWPEGFAAERVVLIHAEGDGVGARRYDEGAPPPALVELRVTRPGLGHAPHRFVLRAAATLGEAHRRVLGLDAAALAEAITSEALPAALAAILPADAICVSWGRHVQTLLGAALLPRLIDLKPLLTDFHKRKLGYIENAAQALGLAAPASEVRGERRLAALRALYLHALSARS